MSNEHLTAIATNTSDELLLVLIMKRLNTLARTAAESELSGDATAFVAIAEKWTEAVLFDYAIDMIEPDGVLGKGEE